MKKRDYSYDWLRAFSAIMIVCCHICQGFGISLTLRYYLGGTFVSVFLLLSAYLLGIRYRDCIATSPILFFIARIKRLVPTYYTYLTIVLAIIGIGIGFDYLSAKQIFGHYLFLNWFIPSTRICHPPLPQLGHLWFMSYIVLAYATIVIFSRLYDNGKYGHRFWLIYLIGTILIGTTLCYYSRSFIYPSVMLTLFPLVFYKGYEIARFLQKKAKLIMLALLILCNLGSVISFYYGLYNYPFCVFWVISINAVLWIFSAPLVFSQTYIPSFIAFLSTISFEIYLVHHPFCLGYYSLVKYMPIGLAIIVVFVVSIVMAYLLSKLVFLSKK